MLSTRDTISAATTSCSCVPLTAARLWALAIASANVFNVALLAARLMAITSWLRDQSATAAVPVGYFGASTGTATHLFPESGALSQVTDLAADWFGRHFARAAAIAAAA